MKSLVSLVCLVSLASLSSALDLPRYYGQEVVVTALKIPQAKTRSPWDVIVLKSDDLKGKLTLNDALREVPGADVKATGGLGSVSTLRMRGATSQQSLILLDGRRINSPLLGMIDLNDVLLSDIERIEVVRAPLSSLYGSDAVGGVVNLITKKAGRELSAAYGSFNTQQLNWLYNGTHINLTHSDGFRRNGDYSSQSIGQNLAFGPLVLDLRYYSADKGVPRVPNSESDPASASTPGDRQKDQNLFGDLSFKQEANNLTTNARVYYNQLDSQFHSYNFFTSLFEDSNYLARQAGAEFGQTVKVSKSADLVYGVEARQDRGQSLYAGDHAVNNYAGFGQVQMGGPYLNFVLGSRVDKHSAFGYAVSPRAGLSFYPVPDLILRASAGNAFKAPTLNDLYWNDPLWQMYGDPLLRPETSQSYELGMEKRLGSNSTLTLNYYNSIIRDLIVWDWNTTTNVTRAKNLGQVLARGWEVEADQQLTPAIKVFGNYTWQESLDSGNDTPYSPRDKYNLGVKVLNHVRLNLSYVGARYADTGNTIRLPDYSLVGVWAGREFGPYQLSLAIDNLFNQVYYESVGYHPTTFAQLKYPMPGRVITISVGGKI